jgi:hypothetical protein
MSEMKTNKTQNTIMKTTRSLLLAAAAAAVLTASYNVRAANFSPSDLSNRAIAASPRAKEQFPWLTRQPSAVRSTSRAEIVSTIKKNHAFAASPRMIEQFPELARGEQPTTIASSKSGSGVNPYTLVTKNRAFAASPRALEQFPWLARGYQAEPAKQSVEIAPLK